MTSSKWIRQEVVRNVRSNTSKALVLVPVALAAVVIVTSYSLLDLRHKVDQAIQFQAAGAAITYLSAVGNVSPEQCLALNRVTGVRAAGAIRKLSTSTVITVLPGAPLDTFEVTPGFTDLLSNDRSLGTGVAVSTEVTDALGVDKGDVIASDRGNLRIAADFAYPQDGRRSGLGWGILVATNSQTLFDECWVATWPLNPDIKSLLLSVVQNPQDIKDLEIAQLNTRFGEAPDTDIGFPDRISAASPLLALVLGFLIGTFAYRLRRLELAANRHAGLSTRHLLRIALGESLVWIAPAVIGGATMGLAIGHGLPWDDSAAFVIEAGKIATAWLLGSLGGVISAVAAVHETQFYKHFKERN